MKSLELNLKDLFHYAYATNCHLDDYSVSKHELDSISTFTAQELLENFKDLILDLLNYKKTQKESKSKDLIQSLTAQHQNEIQYYIKVQKELKNLLEISVSREEKLLEAHEQALNRVKDLEFLTATLGKSEKVSNWNLVKSDLTGKIAELNEKVEQREIFLNKIESENVRLKSMLEEKFIEIEIMKKNMKKKLMKGKEGKSSVNIDNAKKHMEEKAMELVQNQQKIREKITGQVLRERNRESRKSYNSQDFSNLIVHSLDMKSVRQHKRSSSDCKN